MDSKSKPVTHMSDCLPTDVHMAGQAATSQAEDGVTRPEVLHSSTACNHHACAIAARSARVARIHAQDIEHIPVAGK